ANCSWLTTGEPLSSHPFDDTCPVLNSVFMSGDKLDRPLTISRVPQHPQLVAECSHSARKGELPDQVAFDQMLLLGEEVDQMATEELQIPCIPWLAAVVNFLILRYKRAQFGGALNLEVSLMCSADHVL